MRNVSDADRIFPTLLSDQVSNECAKIVSEIFADQEEKQSFGHSPGQLKDYAGEVADKVQTRIIDKLMPEQRVDCFREAMVLNIFINMRNSIYKKKALSEMITALEEVGKSLEQAGILPPENNGPTIRG